MSRSWLSDCVRDKLITFVLALVDQQAARPVVLPEQSASGYWFGGGNVVQDCDGSLLLVGRYRSGGDSRTGLQAGTRGRELALFSSNDGGRTFAKTFSWDKSALSTADSEVLSIEGACLYQESDELRLYVSSEKQWPYPHEIRDYQKPGAGIWSIDVLRGSTLGSLASSAVESVLVSSDPAHLHLKDPFVWDDTSGAAFRLGFCSHPFGWSSSNSGFARLDSGGIPVESIEHNVLSRGTTWDVAMTRATCILPVPQVGVFAERPYTLVFYCGGECVRQLEEHRTAVRRPRGYSCEELGGAAVYVDRDVSTSVRLSELKPLFVSPWGTGCSRYVDVLSTSEGCLATWQQSQADESQPLVRNAVTRRDVESLLA